MSEPLTLSIEHRVSLGQNMPYIRWLLGAGTSLSAILADFGVIVNSTASIDERIAAAQHLLGLLGPIIKDFPQATVGAALSSEALEAFDAELHEAVAAGRFDGSLIRNLIEMLSAHGPEILAFISALIKMFGPMIAVV